MAYLWIPIVLLALAGWKIGQVMSRLRLQAERLRKMLDTELVDRRATERELAHLASFAEIDPNPIVEVNENGVVGYCNPVAMREFPGLEESHGHHPVVEGLTTVVETLKTNRQSLVHRTIQVEERTYDEQVSLIDGGPGIRLYLSDITELKRLDQLKNDLINVVSHELRSPLTTINASIRMVTAGMHGVVNEDQRQSLGLALSGVDRLMRLVNNILDVSKIDAGKVDLQREPVRMDHVVQEVHQAFMPLAKERGIELRHRIEGSNPEINVDRDKMHQVMINLLQNALKFTEKGFVEIQLFLDEKNVRCVIADSGRGIPKEKLGRVFGKFEQFGPNPQGVEKGSGLGLSLCKGIVELHGGTIRVESIVGQGTQFIIDLPRQAAEKSNEQAA